MFRKGSIGERAYSFSTLALIKGNGNGYSSFMEVADWKKCQLAILGETPRTCSSYGCHRKKSALDL